MKGSRYYKNLDFSKPVGTHRYVDNIKDRRQLAKVCLVAMARINQAEQGTITEPYELASSTMKDGRTLIQTIYEDGYVMYNDGWFIVECDEDGTLYVNATRYSNSRMSGVRKHGIYHGRFLSRGSRRVPQGFG